MNEKRLVCRTCKVIPELVLVESADSFEFTAHCPGCGFQGDLNVSLEGALNELLGDEPITPM